MTHAERQARYRTKQAEGAPTFRYRKPVDRRSRFQRWHAICDLDLSELESIVPPRGLAATELLHDVRHDRIAPDWPLTTAY